MSHDRIVIAGGSGFLGRSLSGCLIDRGYEVTVLSRKPDNAPLGTMGVSWDGKTPGAWADHLEVAYAVVNLTGKNVNCRYTRRNLQEIDASRIDSVNAIGKAILACAQPPDVWGQASTLAICGDAGDRICDETAPPGTGIPVQTASMWEQAFNANPTPRTRRVLLRISFAIGPDGGALRTLTKLTRCYLGGRVGSGRQYISWVHIDDLNEMFLWAIGRQTVEGLYNATSPGPVRNADFMRQLRHALDRPWAPPTPTWLVHLGAFFIRTEPVLALTGRRGEPRRFVQQGFRFKFPILGEALVDIFD